MPHTPGPWAVEDRRHAALKNIRVVAAGRREVCQVHDVHQRDLQGSFRGSKEECAAADAIDAIGLANARLIAAAPDAYEILNGIDDYVQCTGTLVIADGSALHMTIKKWLAQADGRAASK